MRRYVVGGMLAVVLALFSAVVWVAYQDLMPDGDAAPPLIRADAGELKREPDKRDELSFASGAYDDAVADFTRAMLLSPGDADISAALERATAQRERVAAERVIDMSPNVPAAPEAEIAAEPAPATETTTAAVEGEPYRVVSAINYRAGPDNGAQQLGTVDAGRIVRVTGDTLGWKHVILPNGDRGFIYGRWLEPV